MIGECNKELQAANMPNPRTCAVCGLGPCRKFEPEPAPAKKSVRDKDELELRQWCVEQAAHWPTESNVIGGAYPPFQRSEVDLLARADRILKWVTGA